MGCTHRSQACQLPKLQRTPRTGTLRVEPKIPGLSVCTSVYLPPAPAPPAAAAGMAPQQRGGLQDITNRPLAAAPRSAEGRTAGANTASLPFCARGARCALSSRALPPPGSASTLVVGCLAGLLVIVETNRIHLVL
jgi:hypothetical protein